MKLNGKAKASIISAGAATIICTIAVASYWSGFQVKISRQAIRDERIDQHVEISEALIPRFYEAETRGRMNHEQVISLQAEVSRLVDSQERTNQKLDRLTETLLDFLATRSKRVSP